MGTPKTDLVMVFCNKTLRKSHRAPADTLAVSKSGRHQDGNWKFLTLLVTTLLLALPGCGDATPPTFTELPAISENPNPRVPLAALVQFTASELVATIIDISDGERTWEMTFDRTDLPGDGLPVLGMRPDRRHEVRLTIRDAAGNETPYPEPLVFATPPLPTDPREMPPFRITVSRPEKMEPGMTVVNVRRQIRGEPELNKRFSLLLGLDAAGEVVWYYRADERVSDVEQLPNGHLMFLTTEFRAVEIDMLGNTIRVWYAADRPQGPADGVPVKTLTFHHDIDLLPSGNLLVLGTQERVLDEFHALEIAPPGETVRNAKVMADEIVEFQPDGTVVWRWNAFDHLPVDRMGYDMFPDYWPNRGFPETLDWTHGNGLYYDARDNTILASLRLQDAVIKIDRESGAVRWIFGNPAGWPSRFQDRLLKPLDGMRWFYHQHAPSITPDGTLLLYDNGNFGAFPPTPPVPLSKTFTRAAEYSIDEASGTVREVWTSEQAADEGLVVSLAMGEADWLSQTGNILLCYGACARRTEPNLDYSLAGRVSRWTRVREFTHSQPAEVIWEFIIGDPSGENRSVVGWSAYGSQRIPWLYD